MNAREKLVEDLELSQLVIDIESERLQAAELAVFAARRERERVISRLTKLVLKEFNK